MWTILWGVNFNVPQPWEEIPRPLRVARELATGPDYRSEGRYRQGEDHCVFHYTLRGQGEWWLHGQRGNVHAGEGILAIIDEVTGGYGHAQNTEDWEFIWIGFSGGNCRRIVAELIRRNGPVFRVPLLSAVLQRELALQKQRGRTLELDPFAGASWVYELLTTLGATITAPVAPQRQSLIDDVSKRIEARLLEGISVKQLAREFGMSREHLERTFRQNRGSTLREFLQQRKMAQACRWLKGSTRGVKEIAAELRYSSPVSFCRAFRRHMRLTPMEFRRFGVMPLFAEESTRG